MTIKGMLSQSNLKVQLNRPLQSIVESILGKIFQILNTLRYSGMAIKIYFAFLLVFVWNFNLKLEYL